MIFNKASLTTGITLAASILATEIRRITSVGGVGGYPDAIPKSITVGTAVVTDTGASIDISTVDQGEENVELTLAFELGAKPHPIDPGPGKDFLAFLWPNAPPELANRQSKKTGMYVFTHVNHPGMKPNPFLDRAFQNVSTKMLEVIGQNFEITMVGPKVEVIK